MLIYNHRKEFIGIDSQDLKSLGFSNLSQFLAEAADFADMFVKKPGFIHNFKHVSWIDFVECADSTESSKVIVHSNGRNFQFFLSVETAYLADNPSEKAFLVHLAHQKELSDNQTTYAAVDLLAQSKPEYSDVSQVVIPPVVEAVIPPKKLDTSFEEEKIDFDAPLDLDIHNESDLEKSLEIDLEDSYKKEENVIEVEKTETTSHLEVYDNGYSFDPAIASSELGLPVELIEEFIQDFIAQAQDFKEDLYNSLNDGDIDNVKILSHKLKGVAANLRIEDALESLTIINTHENQLEIKKELDIFYMIISKLSGEKIAIESTTPIKVVEEVDDDNDDELDIFSTPIEMEKDNIEIDFKEEKEEEFKIEIQDENLEPDFIEEKEEEFKIEIQDEEVPSQIDMPELADDIFEPVEEVVETLEIQEEPVLEDTLTQKVEKIIYNKEYIAGEIGLSQESFNELFEDYLQEAEILSKSINTAIEEENTQTWQGQARKLKGMSDNMRIKEFTKELETLLLTEESTIAQDAIDKVSSMLTQLSKKED